MANDIVNITCYGKTAQMPRRKAYRFYVEAALECDGSEEDRYCSVAYGLSNGYKNCNDNWEY